MKLLPTIGLSAAIAIIGAGAGCARTPATTTAGTAAPKPPATTPAATPTRGEKAAISKACSEQADAKNLHGRNGKSSARTASEAAANRPERRAAKRPDTLS